MSDVTEELWWRDEDAEYIRHRSSRYPGATDLEPAWTLEAAADPRRIVLDPDPKSRTGAVRIIGYSASAGFIITIIATGGARAGVTRAEKHWCGPAGLRGAGMRVNETPDTRAWQRDQDGAIADEVSAVRAEYAEEEAEAAERDAAENAAALEVSLSLRITRELDLALKRRAAQEQVSPSALIRRLLRQATAGGNQPVLTVEQVEEIARRVMRESA
jgi:hypothetical protein